jgi:acetone carboxylase gamma subunit
MSNAILKMQTIALVSEVGQLRAENARLNAEIAVKDREIHAMRAYIASMTSDIEVIELREVVAEHYALEH